VDFTNIELRLELTVIRERNYGRLVWCSQASYRKIHATRYMMFVCQIVRVTSKIQMQKRQGRKLWGTYRTGATQVQSHF